MKLNDYGFVIWVLSKVNQLHKSVYVVFDRVPPLVPAHSLKFGEHSDLFIFGAKQFFELSFESLPILVIPPSQSLFPVHGLIRKVSYSIWFEKGQGPVYVHLVSLEQVSTDTKVDVAGVEEGPSFFSVSIEIWERCRFDSHLSCTEAQYFAFFSRCETCFGLFSHFLHIDF